MARTETRMVKLAELVLDFNLYPRVQVDSTHVASLRRAFGAGCEFPPIVVDAKSLRIIDGFHRYNVYKRDLDKQAEIEVVAKRYRNESEMLLDAIRYNARHGRMFSSYDRAHSVLKATELGVDDVALASALNVDPKYIGELRTDKTAKCGELHVPIKRTIRHMAGRDLTKQQHQANDRLGGMSQMFYVNQLITLIESKLIDRGNEALALRLHRLASLLEAA